MTDIEYRIRAAVAGLAAGDAIAWPSWWHRLAQLPPRREWRLGQAWQHNRELRSTSLPTPYLQSSPPSLIDAAGPADDAEWFVVALRHHLSQGLDGSRLETGTVWEQLVEQRREHEDAVRARIGTIIALENLASGLRPPLSGLHNPHYFDDIVCVRALAAGLLRPGDPAAAADLATPEAEVTHALDGIYAARATAALIAALLGAVEAPKAIDAALAELPQHSWCRSVVEECLAVRGTEKPLSLAAQLEREVVDHVYAYSNQAPETLGLAMVHLLAADSAEGLLLGVLAHPRHADALVPLAGALAGAWFGDVGRAELPTLRGASVRALAGVRLEDVTAQIIAAAATAAGSAERTP